MECVCSQRLALGTWGHPPEAASGHRLKAALVHDSGRGSVFRLGSPVHCPAFLGFNHGPCPVPFGCGNLVLFITPPT